MANETATPTAPALPNPVIPPASALPPTPKVSSNILSSVREVKQRFKDEASSSNKREENRKAGTPAPVVPPVEKKPDGDQAPPNPVPKDDAQAGLKPPPNDKEENLANLRKAREASDARAAALEKQLLETQGKIPTDYEQLRADREMLIKEIEKRDVTASPRFQEKYDKPMAQQTAAIKKTLGLTDVPADQFLEIVALPESKERNAKLGEMMEGLDRISSGKIETALAEHDRIRDMRAQEMVNPDQAWQASQRDNQERMNAAKQQQQQILERSITDAESKIPWFKKIEGNETWNKRVESVKETARNFWNGQHSSEELAQLTIAGALAPMQAEALNLAYQENERLQAELAEIKGAKPSARAGSGGSDGGAGGKKGDKYEGYGSLGSLVRAKAMGQ